MAKKNQLTALIEWLVIVGAVLWGLFPFGVDVVEMIAGAINPTIATVVYVAVGIAGLIAGAKKLGFMK